MRRKPKNEIPIGVRCNAALEHALDQSEADRPKLATKLPFGYRLMQSPFEVSVIQAARYARNCGRSGRWIADELNRRGIRHKGKAWTVRAVCRILQGESKGKAADNEHLQTIFDDLENFAEFMKKTELDY